MDRAAFLSWSGGAAVTLGTLAAGTWVDQAVAVGKRTAAGPLTDLDLALARIAVAVEILATEFYKHAIESKRFGGVELRSLERARFNEQEHLTTVSQIVTGAGQTPSTADDFTITFPKGAFVSRASLAKLGETLETLSLGAYLGAVDRFSADDLKTAAARIAASEAEHLSLFSNLSSQRPVGISFPAPIDYQTVSDSLDAYLS